MLNFEDLFVASQAVRRKLVDPERLRAILSQLDGLPDRVVLARYLHEQQGVAMEHAKAIHDAAQAYLRRRSEDAYAALLRRANVVPAHVVEALALEQAQAGYVWGLGEKLTQEQSLPVEQHRKIQEETLAALGQEEQRMLQQNRETQFAPILGPPRADGRASASHSVAGSSPDARASGQYAVDPRASGQYAVDPRASGQYAVDPRASGQHAVDARTSGRHVDARTSGRHVDARTSGRHTDARSPSREGVIGSSPDARGSNQGAVPPPPPPPPPPMSDSADGEKTLTLPAMPRPPEEFQAPVGHTIRMNPGQVLALPGVVPGGQQPARPADPFSTMTFNPGEAVAGSSTQIGAPATPTRTGPVLGIGEVLEGKYTLQSELGRGAMGVVYKATGPAGETVAIKVVQGPATEEVRGRFEREILVSQRAIHQHVIEVFDAGELKSGSSYMVMEYLEGESLQGILLREGAQSIERALDLLEQLFRGLEACHEKQIVHRDLKPENLQVIQRNGRDHVKIMDFGVSRFLDQAATDENLFMTMRGQLSGTPQYVAPEAVLEPDVVLTSHDVYASGVILYELLAGALPFSDARTLRDLLADTVHSRPKPLDEANPKNAPFPEPIQRLVRRLLEKDPEARPANGAEGLALMAEIRQALAEGPAPDPNEGITRRFIRKITGIFSRKTESS